MGGKYIPYMDGTVDGQNLANHLLDDDCPHYL